MFVAIERLSMAVAILIFMHDEQNKDGGRHATPFDSDKHFISSASDMHLNQHITKQNNHAHHKY